MSKRAVEESPETAAGIASTGAINRPSPFAAESRSESQRAPPPALAPASAWPGPRTFVAGSAQTRGDLNISELKFIIFDSLIFHFAFSLIFAASPAKKPRLDEEDQMEGPEEEQHGGRGGDEGEEPGEAPVEVRPLHLPSRLVSFTCPSFSPVASAQDLLGSSSGSLTASLP